MRLLKGLCDRLIADNRGTIALIFGLASPVLLVAAASAIEVAIQVKANTELQSVADAAALAAAREIALANANASQVQKAAETHARISLTNSKTIGSSAGKLAVNATVVDSFTGVRVDLTKTWKPFFSGLLGVADQKAAATATAHVVGSTKICVLGLMDRGVLAGVHLDNNARLTAEDCGVYSNSTSFASIRTDSNSELSAGLICAAGGTMASRSVSFTPEPITDCPQLPDPLSERKPPPVDSCLETNLVVETDTVLSPGTYCGGLTIRDEAEVELRPGIYVIKDGPFNVEDEAELEGEYVSFYLVGDGSTFNFEEDTEISIGASKDGPLAGLLFYEALDPAVVAAAERRSSFFSVFSDLGALKTMRTHRIKSNDARQLLGTIYLPNSILQIDANAPVADESAYTAVVVRRLWLLEGPHLVLNADYSATDVPVPSSIAGGEAKLTN